MSRYRSISAPGAEPVHALRVQKGMHIDAPEWFYEAARQGRLTFKGMGKFLQDIPSVAIHLPSGNIVRAEEGDWLVLSKGDSLAAWSPDAFQSNFERVLS